MKARNSSPVSFGGICAAVAFLAATGAAMVLFHINFFLAASLVFFAAFVILPIIKFIP